MTSDIRAETLYRWMKSAKYRSYDPFDLQSTGIAHTLSNKLEGTPLHYPLLGGMYYAGQWFPRSSRIFIRKTKATHTVALVAQSEMIMGISPKSSLDWLEQNTCTGYSGYCWGLPFNWQMGRGEAYATTNTPHSTITPYITDAFIKAYEFTKNARYKQIAISSLDFLTKDLHVTYSDEDRLGLSYSPIDNFRVINVNAYVAGTLHTLLPYISDTEKRNELISFSNKLINFVVSEQNEDGSWDYWIKGTSGNGRDALHQIYILQWLSRCKERTDILKSIHIGEDYLVEYMDEDGLINKFTQGGRKQIELIDNAEFAILMDSRLHLELTHETFSLPGKPYYSPVITKYHKFPLPYMRWGNAQMLYALCKVLQPCQNC